MQRVLFVILLLVPSLRAFADGPASQPALSFLRDVAPVLVAQCQECHGPKKQKGNYRVDTFAAVMKAGESGDAAVTAGDPKASQLFVRLRAADEADRMPQKADPLPDKQVEAIRRWIAAGAKFDGADPAAPLASLVAAREHPAPPDEYPRPVPVTALAYSPDGATLAVSGYREVTLWSAADGRLVSRIKGMAERTFGLAYSPDGKSLAVASGTPGSLGEVRLIDTGNPTAGGKVLDRIADVMLAVAFSPDGAKLAAGGADNAVRVYDVASGKRELLIEQHADWITDVAFSPDGTRLASASRDKSARVFDAKTGAVQAAYLNQEETIFGVAWAEDGNTVFTAGHDRKVHAWTPALEPKALGQIGGFAADPFKVRTAPGGQLFVCCADGTVRQYNASTRALVREYPKSSDWVYDLAIDAKNHRLAAGTYAGEVRIFNYDTGEAVGGFIPSPGYKPHP